MKISITQQQLGKALDILISCAKKKWHFSTQEKIANMIMKAHDKEDIISKIENVVKENCELDALSMIDTL